MLNPRPPPPPPRQGVMGGYNPQDIGEEVEASIVVRQPLRPPRPCHPGNLPKCIE